MAQILLSTRFHVDESWMLLPTGGTPPEKQLNLGADVPVSQAVGKEQSNALRPHIVDTVQHVSGVRPCHVMWSRVNPRGWSVPMQRTICPSPCRLGTQPADGIE